MGIARRRHPLRGMRGRHYAVAAGGRDMTCRTAVEHLLKHSPAWPLLEALAITAAALLVVTLAVELGAAVAACLPL